MKQLEVIFKDMGRIDYAQAWDLQEKLLKENTDLKLSFRGYPVSEVPTKSYLLFCEHPHVYTLGKSGKQEHLLINDTELKNKDISYFKINRGGDITYHGPGQITGYPIFDLEKLKPDLHWYLRKMEEIMIRLLSDYGLTGGRIKGATGVWLNVDTPNPRKICAMGIRCSRWVTMHGFAFNVDTDLSYFGNIVPCGINDKGVTSLQAELGRRVDGEEVKSKLLKYFAEEFDLIYTKEDQS